MTDTVPAYANSPATYGGVAKTFHWLTALLILTAIPLGVVANNWPYETSAQLAVKGNLFSIHKTVGLAAFLVASLRILWALSQPKPGLLHADRKVESWLAETVHWLLYASLVIVPLSGWLHHAATTGFAPIWWPFGQSLPFVPVDDTLAKVFAAAHWTFTKVLVASLLLHVAGALKHHFVDRDLTLARMLPGRTVAPEATPGHGALPVASAAGIYAAAMAVAGFLALSGAPAASVQTTDLAAAAPSQWSVQDGTLRITVTQMGSPVEGTFSNWNAAIDFDADAPGEVKGDVTVQVAIDSLSLGSITSEAMKPEFFAVEAHPTATFAADIRDAEGENTYVADGTLTLKGVEAPVTLPFTLEIDGDTAQMDGTLTLDRRTFDIGVENYADESSVQFDVAVDVSVTATRAE